MRSELCTYMCYFLIEHFIKTKNNAIIKKSIKNLLGTLWIGLTFPFYFVISSRELLLDTWQICINKIIFRTKTSSLGTYIWILLSCILTCVVTYIKKLTIKKSKRTQPWKSMYMYNVYPLQKYFGLDSRS